MKTDNENQGLKRRFQLWLKPDIYNLIDENYKKDDCRSRCEFVERAIIFYSGYITSEQNQNYLSRALTEILKSIVKDDSSKQNMFLFKVAVELSMLVNILASMEKIDPESLNQLRKDCVLEVRKINGSIMLEDAMKYQNRE